MDVEETIEEQEDRIKKYKTDGDRHFTEEGRNGESTFDLVLKARATMAEEVINGPEDSIVAEI